ncbi:MAG: divalent metal cation transporter, partial [Bacillota bacterium]
LSLSVAFFINAAILIVSATVFYFNEYREVTELQEAYKLLSPLMGGSLASFLFAIALFAAGQSSTITGAIAGQVILEGFLNVKMSMWLRRLIARVLAIVPAWIGVHLMGETAVGKLLVGTQVVLSLQLPFAMVPLVLFARDKGLMGVWALSKKFQFIGGFFCAVVIAANIFMLVQLFS